MRALALMILMLPAVAFGLTREQSRTLRVEVAKLQAQGHTSEYALLRLLKQGTVTYVPKVVSVTKSAERLVWESVYTNVLAPYGLTYTNSTSQIYGAFSYYIASTNTDVRVAAQNDALRALAAMEYFTANNIDITTADGALTCVKTNPPPYTIITDVPITFTITLDDVRRAQ